MNKIKFVFALHNHQPIGNFDGVIEEAYRTSYLPFLETIERYPSIQTVLHTSGPLMEWLVDRRPEYIKRVAALVSEGRIEILGGGFYEPILPMIPAADRVDQIQSYSRYLADLFGCEIRGAWIAERVWEQRLTVDLVEAGIEYTVLDDFHFLRAGLVDRDLRGYRLTDDEGRILKVFPGSERARYLVPFSDPHATIDYLRRLADEHPGAIVVHADDGEKFGSWPKTYDHVYKFGWLSRFLDMLAENSDWIETTTLARAAIETLPTGSIYLPDCSYREMTEWAMETSAALEFKDAVRGAWGVPQAERLLRFARGGGFWRNFLAKYPESRAMYARMLGVSERLRSIEAASRSADSESGGRLNSAQSTLVAEARRELFRSQCNCAYWHGSFGGLYLPHLRGAIYRGLIAADDLLDRAQGREGPRASCKIHDFNIDLRKEAKLENEALIAFVAPARGGRIYELDARSARVNLLATLARRQEPYHQGIEAREFRQENNHSSVNGDPAFWSRTIVYDSGPLEALVDRFYPLDLNLETLRRGGDHDRGDFASGAFSATVHRGANRVVLAMERTGSAGDHPIVVRKNVTIEAGRPRLLIEYVLEQIPKHSRLNFAIEFQVASMAGRADDRYYRDGAGERLGYLDSTLDIASTDRIAAVDHWLDVSSELSWSRPAALWTYPIETINGSEAGIERVFQSSAIIPRWIVEPDSAGKWTLAIEWTISSAAYIASTESTGERARALATSNA
jgi:alpha-amylase